MLNLRVDKLFGHDHLLGPFTTNSISASSGNFSITYLTPVANPMSDPANPEVMLPDGQNFVAKGISIATDEDVAILVGLSYQLLKNGVVVETGNIPFVVGSAGTVGGWVRHRFSTAITFTPSDTLGIKLRNISNTVLNNETNIWLYYSNNEHDN